MKPEPEPPSVVLHKPSIDWPNLADEHQQDSDRLEHSNAQIGRPLGGERPEKVTASAFPTDLRTNHR